MLLASHSALSCMKAKPYTLVRTVRAPIRLLTEDVGCNKTRTDEEIDCCVRQPSTPPLLHHSRRFRCRPPFSPGAQAAAAEARSTCQRDRNK